MLYKKGTFLSLAAVANALSAAAPPKSSLSVANADSSHVGQTGQETSQVVVSVDPATIGKAHLTDNSVSVASDAAQMAEPISQDSETGLGFNTKF